MEESSKEKLNDTIASEKTVSRFCPRGTGFFLPRIFRLIFSFSAIYREILILFGLDKPFGRRIRL